MNNPNLGLFQFHLRVRTDLPVTSSSLSLSVSSGLKTYLISGRKVEPHSHCSCSQSGLAGPEHADPRCPTSRVHTPDGAPSACTLPPDSVKVSARYLWGNYMKHQPYWGGSKNFNCISILPEEEHVLLQPLWCSSACSLCSFVYVGVLEALTHMFHFFTCKECLKWRKWKTKVEFFNPVITRHLNFSICSVFEWFLPWVHCKVRTSLLISLFTLRVPSFLCSHTWICVAPQASLNPYHKESDTKTRIS